MVVLQIFVILVCSWEDGSSESFYSAILLGSPIIFFFQTWCSFSFKKLSSFCCHSQLMYSTIYVFSEICLPSPFTPVWFTVSSFSWCETSRDPCRWMTPCTVIDRAESGLLSEVVIVPRCSSKGHKVSTLITRGSPCVSVAVVEWLKIWGWAATFKPRDELCCW